MSDDLQVKGGVVGASAPTAPTALSSADADQAASRLAPRELQSTGAERAEEACDHDYVSEGGWPFCTHCEQPAPEDYFDGDSETFYRAEFGW